MLSISGIAAPGAVLPACIRPAQAGAPAPNASFPPAGRALSRLAAQPTASPDPASPRPAAAFLAQLIATAQQAPQTRRKRRAEPAEVSSLYAAAATPAPWIGCAVYRSF
ncbi:MAG TPA: hypothetical protein VKW08_24200 [Xanthobacteraceae bacterium]|nr:hypothetical protein [Xanthobacteraceae bacterium]